jgi:inhibitor of cysteine peptidase
MKKMKLALMITLLTGLLLAACQPASPVDTPPVDEDYAYGQDATVTSVDVLLMESFPLQAQAVIEGYLPDGCTELYDVSVEREDQSFIVTLTTRRPTGDVACTMALEPFEENISLDIEGLEAETYTVIAQDQQAQFTLDVDNVLGGDPIEPINNGGNDVILTSDAVVENLSVMIMESYPVQVSVQLSGYLPDGCTTIKEVRSSKDGDTFTISIVTQRPGGDVACTMAIVPFEENVPLEVEGLPAGEYTVRVGELSETFTLEMDN